MPFTIVTQGTFTQPMTAINQIIPLPSGADYFVSTNLTKMASASTTGCVRGEWFGGLVLSSVLMMVCNGRNRQVTLLA